MITRIKLDNGVRIIAEKIPTVRSISIGIWIGTGSRFETKEENGVSHFLEHMFFKGTKTRSAQEIAESFDRIGGQVNAFTAKEYTCIYAKVLDDHAGFAVDVLADMFFNSVFNEEEIERERKVVYEEIKMVDDTPDDIVHDLLSIASYGDHPLAYPILGTVDRLESFTASTLRSYMERHYTGDRVVVSIAGNVSPEMIEQLKSIFSAVAPTTSEHEEIRPLFQPNVHVRKKDTEQAHLCIGYPGLSLGDKNAYALVLLNNLLGGSMSSRLFQEIREKQGLCYSVFSYHTSFQDTGMLTIYAGTAHEQLDDLAQAIKHTADVLGEVGMNEKELALGKEQLKGSLMLSLESTSSRMTRNGKNELLLKRHRSLDEIIEAINAVSLSQVNELAAGLLQAKPSISLVNRTGMLPKGL